MLTDVNALEVVKKKTVCSAGTLGFRQSSPLHGASDLKKGTQRERREIEIIDSHIDIALNRLILPLGTMSIRTSMTWMRHFQIAGRIHTESPEICPMFSELFGRTWHPVVDRHESSTGSF